MFFFGNRSRALSGPDLEGTVCPSCGHQHFHSFGAYRYFHIWFFPFFPTSRKVMIECDHCKLTLVDSEIPADLLKQIKSRMFTKKQTASMFLGPILLLALSPVAHFYEGKHQDEMAAILDKPAVNDFYIVNANKMFDEHKLMFKYTILKVTGVDGQNVTMVVNKNSYRKERFAREAVEDHKSDAQEFFTEKSMVLPVAQLKSWKADDTIEEVIRD